MTETPTTRTDAEAEQAIDRPEPTDEEAASTDGTDTGSDSGTGLDPRSETVRRYLAWGALGVCSLLAVFALVQFYGSVIDVIELWVEPKYQPLMSAAFNLAVLLTSLLGVSLLVRDLN